MPIEIRNAKKTEYNDFFAVLTGAFSGDRKLEDDERFRNILEQERMLVAVDGKDFVGAAATFSMNLSVPGSETSAGGVTMVGVLPTHRRRGILRSLMRAQFEDSMSRREPIAILWASEGAIYTNFGYGMATRHGAIEIEREHAVLRTPPAANARSILLSRDEALKVLPDIYERMRAGVAGTFERSAEWWEAHRFYDPSHDREGAGPQTFVLIEMDGRPEAYAIYNVRQKWGADGITASLLYVIEEAAVTPRAHIEVWRYLFGVDLVARFRANWLPVDHPLTWVLQEPRRLRMRVQDGLWLRLIDLPAALSQRAFAVDGRIVIEVDDPLLEENKGVWSVTIEEGRATVAGTKDAPDLSLGIEELGAVYLGGVSFTELARAARITERTPGALRRADAMFRWDPQPWCPELF